MKKIISFLLRSIDCIFPPQVASAHCDVPCGLYSPDAAKMAADTVAKMVEKITSLSPPTVIGDRDAMQEYENAITRMIATKEQHAELCKRELLILWTDFFKPEHLALFPDLHETFWQAAKLCSKNKQSVDSQAATALQEAVAKIAETFNKAKSV